MNKNYVEKNVLSAIEKAMTKADRKLFKSGNGIAFVAITRANELKRWGNECTFTLTTRCGALGRNSLVSSAYSDDEDAAWAEARNALSYFVYGDPNEYKIRVFVVEKGDHPWWHWDIAIDRESAENILTKAFGTKAEVYGENFVLTQSPILRALSWDEEDTSYQYDLDTLKSRHRGIDGCFWTEWE